MNNTIFLIDGFNLYHSTIDVASKLGVKSAKWLDIFSLCSSYLYLFGKSASLESVVYFSALATHLQAKNPDKIVRHTRYIECLKDMGVEVVLSQFKEKEIVCFNCNNVIKRHEEKETDVAIAARLLAAVVSGKIENIVIVSGDTDLKPAVITAKNLNPNINIRFAFPYMRRNNELIKLAPKSFNIRPKQYIRFQFSDPYVLADGTIIAKPSSW